MLAVEAAVAKVSKYAVPESGDTVETVERPRGGVSLVMADGQRSGRSAKRISNMVVRKAASLLAEGVRDGAAARAANDYLLTARRGQVSADLVIVSADLATRTLVITRNTRTPVLFVQDSETHYLDAPSSSLGTSRLTRPLITEWSLAAGQLVVAFTDGLMEAGCRGMRSAHFPEWLVSLALEHPHSPTTLTDAILSMAVALDHGRPRDDMTVLAVATVDRQESLSVRRMQLSFPIG